MSTTRLEAFSDGVIAILITIMVLELRPPEIFHWHGEAGHAGVADVAKTMLFYAMSFIFLGIYWNNHHHMFHVVQRVNGAVLWANLHLLFWLSLVPFFTAWMGEHHEAIPTALYGVDLLACAIAFSILQWTIIRCEGPQSKLARAVGTATKEKLSVALYTAALPLSFVNPWIADALYFAVACIWLSPDRRVEKLTAE